MLAKDIGDMQRLEKRHEAEKPTVREQPRPIAHKHFENLLDEVLGETFPSRSRCRLFRGTRSRVATPIGCSRGVRNAGDQAFGGHDSVGLSVLRLPNGTNFDGEFIHVAEVNRRIISQDNYDLAILGPYARPDRLGSHRRYEGEKFSFFSDANRLSTMTTAGEIYPTAQATNRAQPCSD